MSIPKSFRQFPLLTSLLVVQVGTLGLGAVAATAVLISANRTQNQSALLRAREAMLPELAANHEKWRAFKHLEMKSALEEVQTSFQSKYPAASFEVVDRESVPNIPSSGLVFFYPEATDNTLESVVMIALDEARAIKQYGGSNFPIGLPLILVFSLVISVFASTYLFRRFFLSPMQKLGSIMAAPEIETSQFPFAQIQAFGEMKRFLDHFGLLYNERKTGQQNAAIAATTQNLAHDVRKPLSMSC